MILEQSVMAQVIVDSRPESLDQLELLMADSIRRLKIDEAFNQARAIFIKPNLTYPHYKVGVTTSSEFVRCLVSCLRKINDSTLIYIGEGEGGYNSFSMSEAMKVMGYFEIADEFKNVRIVNLNQLARRRVNLEAFGKPYPLELPELFFSEVDFSITCPVPKVHCMTGLSLSLKNQWGCVPDVLRLQHHFVFDQIISQICSHLKFRYVFLDGQWGLDDNGPMQGIPRKIDWFVAADSLGAHDVVVSELMGVDWRGIRHLVHAHKQGYLPDKEKIRVIGNSSLLARQFVLNRTFWNYPALIAFHSAWLTKLVYLSRFSKVIHDVMYAFRKRPIDD